MDPIEAAETLDRIAPKLFSSDSVERNAVFNTYFADIAKVKSLWTTASSPTRVKRIAAFWSLLREDENVNIETVAYDSASQTAVIISNPIYTIPGLHLVRMQIPARTVLHLNQESERDPLLVTLMEDTGDFGKTVSESLPFFFSLLSPLFTILFASLGGLLLMAGHTFTRIQVIAARRPPTLLWPVLHPFATVKTFIAIAVLFGLALVQSAFKVYKRKIGNVHFVTILFSNTVCKPSSENVTLCSSKKRALDDEVSSPAKETKKKQARKGEEEQLLASNPIPGESYAAAAAHDIEDAEEEEEVKHSLKGGEEEVHKSDTPGAASYATALVEGDEHGSAEAATPSPVLGDERAKLSSDGKSTSKTVHKSDESGSLSYASAVEEGDAHGNAEAAVEVEPQQGSGRKETQAPTSVATEAPRSDEPGAFSYAKVAKEGEHAQ